MSISMPETPQEMMNIAGITRSNMDKYGAHFLNITVRYSATRFTITMADIDEFDTDEDPSSPKKNQQKQQPPPK